MHPPLFPHPRFFAEVLIQRVRLFWVVLGGSAVRAWCGGAEAGAWVGPWLDAQTDDDASEDNAVRSAVSSFPYIQRCSYVAHALD